jgi:hypothetical protein
MCRCKAIVKDGRTERSCKKKAKRNSQLCHVHENCSSPIKIKPKPIVLGTCSVCLDDAPATPTSCILPGCFHVFHRKCLKQWFYTNHITCPYCRSRIDKQVYLNICNDHNAYDIYVSRVHYAIGSLKCDIEDFRGPHSIRLDEKYFEDAMHGIFKANFTSKKLWDFLSKFEEHLSDVSNTLRTHAS